MSNIKDLQKRALEVQQRYAKLNSKNGHNNWGRKEYAMGLVGDMGDLMKLVMAKENLRSIDGADKKLAHELADCFWSLLVLADKYGIDIEQAFLKTMDELDVRLDGEFS